MTALAPIDEVRKIFNHICIVHDMELVRVIGFHEDVMDYYYIVKTQSGKIYYATFVGPCVSLADSYPRYDIMEQNFHRNGCERAEHFQFTIATDAENYKMYGVLDSG